jgi:hypothetical protein
MEEKRRPVLPQKWRNAPFYGPARTGAPRSQTAILWWPPGGCHRCGPHVSDVTFLAYFDTMALRAEIKSIHGEMLSKVPIFSGQTESEFVFLVQRAVPRRYSAGEIVFWRRRTLPGIVRCGSWTHSIFKSFAGGREHVLSVDGPGCSSHGIARV